jgi:hypothetical protein
MTVIVRASSLLTNTNAGARDCASDARNKGIQAV